MPHEAEAHQDTRRKIREGTLSSYSREWREEARMARVSQHVYFFILVTSHCFLVFCTARGSTLCSKAGAMDLPLFLRGMFWSQRRVTKTGIINSIIRDYS